MTSAWDDIRAAAGDILHQVADRAGADLAHLKTTLDEIEKAGRRHRVDASVTSAVALTDGERDALERRLRDRYGADLPIAYHVDPAILGGMIVRVGDRYVDGSLATRLGQLRRTLTGGGVG